jgi:hypothetical protein
MERKMMKTDGFKKPRKEAILEESNVFLKKIFILSNDATHAEI